MKKMENELLEALTELKDDLMDRLPKTAEEARDFIITDEETMKDIMIAAEIDVLTSMLIDAGIIKETVFRELVAYRAQKTIDSMAEHLINKLESEVFEYEKD